jgi:transposase
LDWPAQSPDMNPIENFWSIIKLKRSKIQARNIEELKAILTEIWYSISKKNCESYALSFKKRAIKVYNVKGGHIDY